MRYLWTPVTLILVLSGVVAVFQNCTPAVPYGSRDYYEELANSTDFPFDLGFDQVAYMSCSEQDGVANDGTFYTFRVGAYNQTGIRINQTYRDNVFQVRDENVVAVLQENQTSSGARVQLALRSMDNYQLMYVDTDNGVKGQDGYDYNNFFPSLGDEKLLDTLWYMQPGDYMRYWAGAEFVNEYRFEGELQFTKSHLMENDLRTFLSNRGLISLTFVPEGEVAPLGPGSFVDIGSGSTLLGTTGSSSTDTSGGVNTASFSSASTANSDVREEVFGMAVQPRFKQPLLPPTRTGSPDSTMPPRALSSLTEVKIDSRTDSAFPRPWDCPEQMQFMIVLPEDAEDEDGNTRCAMVPDAAVPSNTMQIVRRSLFAEDWYVDLSRRCVVPKPDHVSTGSCYGVNSETGNTHFINYDDFETEGCGFDKSGLCPHYVSICIRQ